MTPVEQAERIVEACAALLAALKEGDETITAGDDRRIYNLVREAEGWLTATRHYLDPPGVF